MLAAVMANGSEHDRNGVVEQGAWLSLHDAAKELGILEVLAYRLVSEGKLRSRWQSEGEIQVWVADNDRVRDGAPQSGQESHVGQYLALAERLASAAHYPVDVLTSSLAAAYDRNVQLAGENGALVERLALMERELKLLQDVQERLRSVEATNEQLSRLLSTWMEEQPRKKRHWSPWFVGVSILLLAFLLLVPLLAFLSPMTIAFGGTPLG
jgi:hypothetical protein